MDYRLRSLLPEFACPETEAAYRRQTLDGDIRQMQRAVLAGSTLVLLLLGGDAWFRRPGSELFPLLALWLAVAMSGFALAVAAVHRPGVTLLDQGLWAWTAGLLALLVVASALRPGAASLPALMMQTALLACHLWLPMRISRRLACAAVGTLTYLILQVIATPAAEWLPLAAALVAANLLAAGTTFHLERLRRNDFMHRQTAAAAAEQNSLNEGECRRLAAALASSERRLESIFELAPVPLLLADLNNGRLIRGNLALLELLHVRPNELPALSTTHFYADRTERADAVARLRATGRVDQLEFRARTLDGTSLWLSLSARAVDVGDQTCMLGCLQDIGERKALALAQRSAEKSAEAAVQARSQLLTIVGRELRTPMNGVFGLLQLLDASALTAEQRRHFDLARQSTEVMSQLLDSLLDHLRLESGEVALHNVDFDLARLIASVAALMRGQAEAKGLLLISHVDLPPGMTLTGDVNRLRLVLVQLLNNAIKFTADGSVSVIALVDPPAADGQTQLHIAVADTGIGIAPALQRQIFEPFLQASDPLPASQRGAGMGLALCRGTVSMMGGRLSVDSTPRFGSTFRVWLPLRAQVEAAATDEPESPAPPMPLADFAPDGALAQLIDRSHLRGQLESIGQSNLLALGRMFRSTGQRLLTLLQQEQDADDREAAVDLARRLRSTATALGLTPMRELAALLEIRIGVAEPEELSTLIRDLAEAYNASLLALITAQRELNAHGLVA